jgi:hypothetical protein
MEYENDTKDGAFAIARKLFTSELWLEKPLAWKILWIYILGKVSHSNSGKMRRGIGYFNLTQERRFIGREITNDIIKKALSWFRAMGMIRTTKSTRGIYIEVVKYDFYQTWDNYKHHSRHFQSTTEAPLYNKNDINYKNKHTGENPEKAMYNYEPIDEFGNPLKRKMKKISKKENDELISVGLLWRDMAAKALKMPQDEIIMLNLYFPLRKAFDREGWHFKAFQELFQYFFNDPNIKYEDKLSFDLCLSQKYIAKYKLAKKKKELISTNASVSTDIKL